MLDRYIEELVKTSGVQEKLEAHLQELTKVAAQKYAQEELLKNASTADLAKLAGVKLPEDVCPSCGGEMQKLGSVFQCSCGMMKKAEPLSGFGEAARKIVVEPAKKWLRSSPSKGSQLGAAALLSGAVLGAHTSDRRAAEKREKTAAAQSVFGAAWKAGKKQLKVNELAQAASEKAEEKAEKAGKNPETASRKAYQAKTASVEKVASVKTFNAALQLSRGDVGQALQALESHGYTKLAAPIMPAIKEFGSKIMGSAPVKAVKGAFTKPGNAGTLARMGATAGVGALTGAATAGEGNRGTGALAGGVVGGLAGGVGGGLGRLSRLGKGSATRGAETFRGLGAGANPRLTNALNSPAMNASALKWGLPVAAGTGLATGALIPSQKTASQLLEVGDAAGRILAKIAETPGVDIDPEEVAEAIDEAKERESIPGSTRRGALLGGGLAGLGGGLAGYGLGAGAKRFLGAPGWAKGLGAGLGLLGGAAGGGIYGARAGAEDAQANRLVSFLRGRQAYQTGAQQGLQAGYLQGLTSGQGGQGEEGGPGPQ